MIKQAFASLFIAVLLLIPSSGEGNNTHSWRKCFFDGKEFREGAALSGTSVYFRDGYLPIIRTGREALREYTLPAGTGGLVVFCYIESAGGKLQSHSGYAPLAGAAVEIRNGGRTMVVRSDMEGYSILALPAGECEVLVQGIIKNVRIEKGKTAFVLVRAGKRMVD
jgi:hypothetical protein